MTQILVSGAQSLGWERNHWLGYPVQWTIPESSSTRWASGAGPPNTHEHTLRHPGLLTSKVRRNSQRPVLPGVGRKRKEDRVHHTVRAQEIAALGNRGSHGDNTAITPNFVNFIPHRSHCMVSGHDKYLMRNREPQAGSKRRGRMGAGTPPAARSQTRVSASWGTRGPHRAAVQAAGVLSAVGSRAGCGRSGEVSLGGREGLAACGVRSALGRAARGGRRAVLQGCKEAEDYSVSCDCISFPCLKMTGGSRGGVLTGFCVCHRNKGDLGPTRPGRRTEEGCGRPPVKRPVVPFLTRADEDRRLLSSLGRGRQGQGPGARLGERKRRGGRGEGLKEPPR